MELPAGLPDPEPLGAQCPRCDQPMNRGLVRSSCSDCLTIQENP